MGKLNANSVTVEGKNITFKNVANVKNFAGNAINTDVTLTENSTGEIHIGMAAGEEATSVNDTQYKNVNLSAPMGWTINKDAKDAMYMLVRNGYELQNMQNNLSGKYMLAGDINASSINGFTPIGKDYDNAFTGRFDGLDYKLTGLKVTEPGNGFCGLFGQNKGTIENLEIGGITVVSDRYLEHYIGTVAGDNYGTISNVRNTGG